MKHSRVSNTLSPYKNRIFTMDIFFLIRVYFSKAAIAAINSRQAEIAARCVLISDTNSQSYFLMCSTGIWLLSNHPPIQNKLIESFRPGPAWNISSFLPFYLLFHFFLSSSHSRPLDLMFICLHIYSLNTILAKLPPSLPPSPFWRGFLLEFPAPKRPLLSPLCNHKGITMGNR